MVDRASFKELMLHLKKDAIIPSRRDILKGIKEIRGVLLTQIAKRLEGQHLSVTTDGWTSCANDTHHSFTVSPIDVGWQSTGIEKPKGLVLGGLVLDDLCYSVFGMNKPVGTT